MCPIDNDFVTEQVNEYELVVHKCYMEVNTPFNVAFKTSQSVEKETTGLPYKDKLSEGFHIKCSVDEEVQFYKNDRYSKAHISEAKLKVVSQISDTYPTEFILKSELVSLYITMRRVRNVSLSFMRATGMQLPLSQSSGLIKPFDVSDHIHYNIQKLEEWSGLKYGGPIYESNIYGNSVKIFANRILHHKHLYFIVIDKDNNVFGYYSDREFDKVDDNRSDDKTLMFTLNSNGRCGVSKFVKKNAISVFTSIHRKKEILCECTFKANEDCFCVGMMYSDCSAIKSIDKMFEGVNSNDLIGSDSEDFTAQRLIVVEMK